MRWTLYCHGVRSEDDARIKAYMSSDEGAGPEAEITMIVPFEAFDENETPRTWHRYKLTLERVDDKSPKIRKQQD